MHENELQLLEELYDCDNGLKFNFDKFLTDINTIFTKPVLSYFNNILLVGTWQGSTCQTRRIQDSVLFRSKGYSYRSRGKRTACINVNVKY